jgi:hypothetical protein
MSIFNSKNVDSTLKQKRRYSGRLGNRINLTREFCERSSEAFRGFSVWWKGEGVIMERILKLFGYHEKTANAHEAIKYACLLNVDATERLEKIRATLNGENGWFKENDENGSTSQ